MKKLKTLKQFFSDAEAETDRYLIRFQILPVVYYKLGLWLDSPLLVMASRSRMWGARASGYYPHRLVSLDWLLAIAVVSCFPPVDAFLRNALDDMIQIWLVLAFLLCAYLTLALAGAAIAGEKEKQTLEALFVTPLSSARIVFGKFVLAVCPALLTQAALLPSVILAIALGTAPPWMLFISHILLLATLPALGAIGVFCSSRSRNTVTGVIAAYLAGVLWILVGLFIFHRILFFVELASSDIMKWLLPVALLIASQLLVAYIFFRLTAQHLTSLRSGRKAAMPGFADR